LSKSDKERKEPKAGANMKGKREKAHGADLEKVSVNPERNVRNNHKKTNPPGEGQDGASSERKAVFFILKIHELWT